jgi:hypothetical protein
MSVTHLAEDSPRHTPVASISPFLRVEADRCASIEASPCPVAVAVCGVYADAAYCGPISCGIA